MNSKLKKMRLKLGLTQSQIAIKIKINERSYRRIENENIDPRTSVSIAIASVLKTTVEDLFESPSRQTENTYKSSDKNSQNNNIIKRR